MGGEEEKEEEEEAVEEKEEKEEEEQEAEQEGVRGGGRFRVDRPGGLSAGLLHPGIRQQTERVCPAGHRLCHTPSLTVLRNDSTLKRAVCSRQESYNFPKETTAQKVTHVGGTTAINTWRQKLRSCFLSRRHPNKTCQKSTESMRQKCSASCPGPTLTTQWWAPSSTAALLSTCHKAF